MADRVVIDLWSDLICPWCYLGKARLDQAIELSGRANDITLVLHAFELDQSAPSQTQNVSELLAAKYGRSASEVAVMEERISSLVASEGLPWSGERLSGNTFDIHRVAALASESGLGMRVFDAIQRGYFAGSLNPFSRSELIEAAVDAGLDRKSVETTLDSQDFAKSVRADEQLDGQIGISGVPFIALNMKFGVPGAVETQDFLAAIAEAVASE
jgi:predicted DsbA family dithiol-disulfide isomerase